MIVVFAIILVLAVVYSTFYAEQNGSGPVQLSSFQVESIRIGNLSGNVYVASTSAEQTQGFQNVTSFGDCNGKGNCIGMIFVWNTTQNLCFWMHDTKIPLEQTWIASNGSVIAVYEAQAMDDNSVCHYASYVLETSSSAQIAVGYKLTLISA
jgi:uncharacterized membrane protein (UPF0127 family)